MVKSLRVMAGSNLFVRLCETCEFNCLSAWTSPNASADRVASSVVISRSGRSELDPVSDSAFTGAAVMSCEWHGVVVIRNRSVPLAGRWDS